MRKLLAALGACGVLVAACGGSGSDGGPSGSPGAPSQLSTGASSADTGTGSASTAASTPTCDSLLGDPDWASKVNPNTGCTANGVGQGLVTFQCTDGTTFLAMGEFWGRTNAELHKANQSGSDYQSEYLSCVTGTATPSIS